MDQQAEQAEGTDLSQEDSLHSQTKCQGRLLGKSKCVPFIGPCQRYANKRARRNKRFIEDEDKEEKAILEVRHEQASRQTGNKEVGEGRA